MSDPERIYSRDDLLNFLPGHPSFVGLDSDGCVFDTMEVKQKNHFHPLIIRFWELETIEKQLREAAEFFNLYSVWRGQNRFVELLRVFKALPQMPGVKESGVALPDCAALETYVESGLPLGNPSLEAEVDRTNDPELRRLLDWSLAINREIDENMDAVAPFKWARKSIEKISKHSDMIVVSQTPSAALAKEWQSSELASFADVIAGQEMGTKSEQIRMATEGRYPPGKILIIGDAPGDRQAAEDNQVLFFPIKPGKEEESWELFYREAYGKFVDGTYTADYRERLIGEFEALLPDAVPWK